MAETSGIRAVTFDIGYTLLFPRESVGEGCARAAADVGVQVDPVRAEALFLDAWFAAQKTHRGLVFGTDNESGKRFWRMVLELAMAEFGLAEERIARLTDVLYEWFGRPDVWRVNPAWPEVRDGLRRRGIRLGTVSNWDIRLGEILRTLGIFNEFDAVIVSAEHGLEKPDAALFRKAWTALGVRPDEMLHVGDSWHDDVCGASSAGMRAVWLNASGAACPAPDAPHRQIRYLAELPAVVQEPPAVPL